MNENGSKKPPGISIAKCAEAAAAQGFPYRGSVWFGIARVDYEVTEGKQLTVLTEGFTAVIYRGRITRFTARATTRAPG